MYKNNILSQLNNLEDSLEGEYHKLEKIKELSSSQKSDKVYLSSWLTTLQDMKYEIHHIV